MIQTLINWAEIIGGLAVVISLIFVAIQIRSSVIQSRADSYTKVSELWLQPASDFIEKAGRLLAYLALTIAHKLGHALLETMR